MVSAVLSGTEERTGHEEEGVAHGEGIGGGTPYEPEVDSAGLSQRGDSRAMARSHGAVRSHASPTSDGTQWENSHASSQ